MSTNAPFVIIENRQPLDAAPWFPPESLRVHPVLDPAGFLVPVAGILHLAAGGRRLDRVLVAFDYPGRVSA